LYRITFGKSAVCWQDYHLFIRTILYEHEAHFYSKFKKKLRIIPVSTEEQSLKFSVLQ